MSRGGGVITFLSTASRPADSSKGTHTGNVAGTWILIYNTSDSNMNLYTISLTGITNTGNTHRDSVRTSGRSIPSVGASATGLFLAPATSPASIAFVPTCLAVPLSLRWHLKADTHEVELPELMNHVKMEIAG